LAAAQFFLERGVDPATRDEHGRTALHSACWGARTEIVNLLIEQGAEVDVKESRLHSTPLPSHRSPKSPTIKPES